LDIVDYSKAVFLLVINYQFLLQAFQSITECFYLLAQEIKSSSYILPQIDGQHWSGIFDFTSVSVPMSPFSAPASASSNVRLFV